MQFFCSMNMNPVAKGRPRVSTRNGFIRAYTPSKTVEGELTLQRELKRSWKQIAVSGSVQLSVLFVIPMAESWSEKKKQRFEGKPHTQRPDVDNFLKLVCDAGNGLLWRDDSQIYKIMAEKRWGRVGRIDFFMEWE